MASERMLYKTRVRSPPFEAEPRHSSTATVPTDIMSSNIPDIVVLTQIITQNVGAIQQAYDSAGLLHPSLNDLYSAASAAEQKTLSPNVLRAALLATSAASQLVATLKLPGLALYDRSLQVCLPSLKARIIGPTRH